MIQAAIAGLILLGLYKFIDRNRVPEDFDPEVDWWMALIFVWAPSMIIWLISMGLAIAGLPLYLLLFGYLLYFIIPFLMLKFMLEFKLKRAIIYSCLVPVVAIFIEILMLVVLQTPDN